MNEVVIVVDNPQRDLPSCALLAQALKKYGYTSYLVPMSFTGNFIFRIPQCYVLLNYLRHNNAKLAKQLNKAGYTLGILDTEGGVFTRLPETGQLNFFNNITTDKQLKKAVKNYFVWGEELYRDLIKNQTFAPEQLHLTGTPRTDFYHASFQKYYPNTERKYFLINASFALINPKFSSREAELQMMKSVFGFSPAYIDQLEEQLDHAQKKLMQTAVFLSEKFPNTQIIFRPHPFEDEKVYLNYFQAQPNINVNSEGTVDQWLVQSLVLIHYESSTSLEAACLSVPAFSPFEKTSIRPIHQAEKATTYYSTNQELYEQISAYLKDKKIPNADLTHEALKDVFYKVDGQAATRIASQIAKSMKIADQISVKQNFLKLYFNIYYKILTLAKKILGRKIIQPSKIMTSEKINSLNLRLKNATQVDTHTTEERLSIFKFQ